MFGDFSAKKLNEFYSAYAERQAMDFAQGNGKPCGASHISSAKTCRMGTMERDPSKDVRRKDGTLIGTSPRNMNIDALKDLKKEYENYKKKFGHRSDLKHIMDTYESRIASAEKRLKDEG